MSTGSGSTSCSWLPSKLPLGQGRTLAEAVIRWWKSVAGATPFSPRQPIAEQAKAIGVLFHHPFLDLFWPSS
jgi:hypothetical protein